MRSREGKEKANDSQKWSRKQFQLLQEMEYQGPRFMNGINFQNNVVSPIFHLSFHSSLLFILQFSFFNIYFTLKLQKTISYYHCELDFSNLNLGFRLCLMWYYCLNWRNYINRLLRRKMICKLSEASVERCIRKNNRENKWDYFFSPRRRINV